MNSLVLPNELWLCILDKIDQNSKINFAKYCVKKSKYYYVVELCKYSYINSYYQKYPILKSINSIYYNIDKLNKISSKFQKYGEIYDHFLTKSYSKDLPLIKDYVEKLMVNKPSKKHEIYSMCYYIFVIENRYFYNNRHYSELDTLLKLVV